MVFNDIIKYMHELIWTKTLPEATSWDYWARSLPFNARWAPLLLPPSLGGLAVGLLRKASGGFEDLPQGQPEPTQQQAKPNMVQAAVSAERKPAQAQANGTAQAATGRKQQQPVAEGSTMGSNKTGSNSSSSQDRVSSNEKASTSGRDVGSDSSTVWSVSWLARSTEECRASASRLARPLLKVAAKLHFGMPCCEATQGHNRSMLSAVLQCVACRYFRSRRLKGTFKYFLGTLFGDPLVELQYGAKIITCQLP